LDYVIALDTLRLKLGELINVDAGTVAMIV